LTDLGLREHPIKHADLVRARREGLW
jgi:hypothetical protein